MNGIIPRNQLVLGPDDMTPDYFVEHYMDFLPLYISNGRPREDTLRTYKQHIDAFIDVCRKSNVHPLAMHDFQLRLYVRKLVDTNHSARGVAIRMAAIRAFFGTAHKLKLIRENPCNDIHVSAPFSPDEQFSYFDVKQVQEIFNKIHQDSRDAFRLRDEAMFLLMACEGLRVVEIHRMNDEDIDWDRATILIHGKGHDGVIYPSEGTMKILDSYLNVRPAPKEENGRTPTFVSFSDRNSCKRLGRNGIRTVMNSILDELGYKKLGVSCHAFRHSCGTNLYAETKDLRVVQETLRQRDPKVTARYAHVQRRMTKRVTNAITPNIDDI